VYKPTFIINNSFTGDQQQPPNTQQPKDSSSTTDLKKYLQKQ